MPETPPRRKLAIFINALRGGGAERVMVTLANALAERGYPVDMVLARAHGPYLPEVSSRVRIVDFGTRSAAIGMFRLARYLHAERPHTLLCTNLMSNVGAALVVRACRLPVRLVLNEGSTFSRALEEHRLHPSFAIRMAGKAAPRLYPLADVIIAVSRAAAEDLRRGLGSRPATITTIYNPVITDELLRQSREPADHPWFSETTPVVLAVGRFHRAKDYPTLIRAFALVRARMPARLLILGEGEERPVVENLVAELEVQDAVSMPGFADNPYACMRQASVFVLSSIYEGLPSCLLEAMACGCPLVSTNCPSGPAEILADSTYGHLVPPGDPAKLADAICAVLEGGKKRIDPDWLKQFTLEPAVEKYIHVLELDS